MTEGKTNNFIKIELPNRYKAIVIDKSRMIIDEIWTDNIYEQDFIICKGMTVIDIGANQGFFSLYAASKGAHVYAVEPQETNFSILKRNVELNGLEERVKCFRYAVSSNNNEVDLIIMDFENVSGASGLVTTSSEYFQTVNKTLCAAHKEKVKCKRLASLFPDVSEGKIVDLLKIDCEGAEMDILMSAPMQWFGNVRNIVMEVHSNYEEKDLVHLVHSLGYHIVNYKKVEGIYETGYLFATREFANIKKPVVGLVPILQYDSIVFERRPYRFDLSGSFSLNSEKTSLSYNWIVDGKVLSCRDSSVDYSFESPGEHIVTGIVSDKDQKAEDTQKILVFKKDYFDYKNSIHLPNSETKQILHVNGCVNIIIDRVLFPRDWNPEYFRIGVRFLCPKKTGGLLSFNARNLTLDKVYNELVIENFPMDADIVFSITTDSSVEMELVWWPDSVSGESPIVEVDDMEVRRKGHQMLPKRSEDFYFTSSADDVFVLNGAYLPKDWSPEKIVIGISYCCDPDISYDSFEFNGTVQKFHVNYTEITLLPETIGKFYSITLGKLNKGDHYKIVWWAE